MTTQTIHQLPSKAALARHLVYTHNTLLMDLKEVITWDKEELEAVHRRQHEALKQIEQK